MSSCMAFTRFLRTSRSLPVSSARCSAETATSVAALDLNKEATQRSFALSLQEQFKKNLSKTSTKVSIVLFGISKRYMLKTATLRLSYGEDIYFGRSAADTA